MRIIIYSKIQSVFLLMLFAIIMIIPIASAENVKVTPATTPFITIDPIGNHTVGDVFTIYGTTNLPVINDSLFLQIGTADFNPGGFGSSFYMLNISEQPGKNGVNTWSANVIPTLWEIYTEPPNYYPTPTFESIAPGEYLVGVSSQDPLGPAVTTTQYFFMFSPENRSIPSQTSASTPRISPNQAPTTQSSPLSVLLSITVLAGIVIVDAYLRKSESYDVNQFPYSCYNID